MIGIAGTPLSADAQDQREQEIVIEHVYEVDMSAKPGIRLQVKSRDSHVVMMP